MPGIAPSGEISRELACRALLLGSAAILLIWVVASGLVFGIRTSAPSVASVCGFITRHPLEGKTEADRARIIEKVTPQVALLDYSQQRALTEAPELRGLYRSFTTEEKERFLQLTIPSTLRNIFRAAGARPSAEREKFVNLAFYELETIGSKDESAPVHEHRVRAWTYTAAREAFFNSPLGLRLELKLVIELNLPGFLKQP